MVALEKVALCSGLEVDGRRHTIAELRPFTGAEEAAFVDATPRMLPAEKSTWLLARLVERIGEIHPVSEHHVRQLTVGDRERLWFALCAATFSEEMDLVARCTFEECGELSEVTLSFSEWIRRAPDIQPAGCYEVDIETEKGAWTLRFRFPTGADQEAASRRLFSQSHDEVERELIRNCLLEVRDSEGAPVAFDNHLHDLKPHLEAAWSEIDPLGDCFAKVECSACGRPYTAVADGLTLFEARLENRGDIFEQVHRLARVYHWSERELLALTFARRQRYLALVDLQGGAA